LEIPSLAERRKRIGVFGGGVFAGAGWHSVIAIVAICERRRGRDRSTPQQPPSTTLRVARLQQTPTSYFPSLAAGAAGLSPEGRGKESRSPNLAPPGRGRAKRGRGEVREGE
jgi:hypothetical protein